MFELKKLAIDDKKDIDTFTKNFDPYSDFNFTSIWSNNINNDVEFFLDSDCFVMKLPDYITNKPTYSFLSRRSSSQIVQILFNQMKKENLDIKLKLIPEVSLTDELKNDQTLVIEEDRDSFDYVLSVPEVASLQSPLLKHKRRHINQFLREYPYLETKTSKIMDENEKLQILDIYDQWAQSKTSRDTSHERQAIDRLLTFSNDLDIYNMGIWDKDKLIAFNIFEHIGEYTMGHFMKADTKYTNIYDILYYKESLHLNLLGCKFVNYEQDLGILPMREAKLHWHPVKFLKKYIISPKQ